MRHQSSSASSPWRRLASLTRAAAFLLTLALLASTAAANLEWHSDGVDQQVASLLESLPPKLLHTAAVVWANVAAVNGDWASWTRYINAFLAHYNTSAVRIDVTTFVNPQASEARPAGEDGGVCDDDGGGGPGGDFMSCLVSAVPVQQVPCGPLISVIMVAHDAASTVIPAVASVLDQTWRHLELVIVDDASTDNTWSILNRLQAADERIRLLRNRVRVGPYVSRNRALQQAVRGSYITGHDADDWAHPSRLESQVRVLLESGGRVRANVAYMLRIKPDGRIATSVLSWFSPDGAAKIAMVSAMFERHLLLDELGHWDSVHYGADAEMIGRAKTLLGDGFVEVPIISMLCRDRATGLGKSGYNSPATVRTTASDGPGSLGRANGGSSGGIHKVPVSWAESNRARYREAFERWHATVRATGDAYLPFIHEVRRFHAPDGMAVDIRKVRLLVMSSRKVLRHGDRTPWAHLHADHGCGGHAFPGADAAAGRPADADPAAAGAMAAATT
jgi:glycosyltransferase involved in cell wall biosynthesis